MSIQLTARVTTAFVPDGFGSTSTGGQVLTVTAEFPTGTIPPVVVPGGNHPTAAQVAAAINTLTTNLAAVLGSVSNLAIMSSWGVSTSGSALPTPAPAPAPAPAFDWFFDPAGSDANDGKTSATAFATLAHAATAIGATPNQRVGLKSGSTFTNDALFISAEGTSVGVYGGSSLVIIDGAAPIAPGAWTKTAGLTNVYQADITSAVGGANIYLSVFENYTTTSPTALFSNVTTNAACDALAGSYVWADNQGPNSGGAGTLFIHATGDSDPRVNGKTYEFSNQIFGIKLAGTSGNLSVVGAIEARRNSHANGPIQAQAPSGGLVTLGGVTARMGTRHNAIVTAPFSVSGCTFVDNNPTIASTGTASLLVVNQATGSGQNGTFSGNTYSSTLPLTSALAASSHTTSGNYDTFTMTDETLSATAGALSGFAMGGVNNVIVNNPTSTNVNAPISPSSNMTIAGGALKGGTAAFPQISLAADNITVNINGLTACADNLANLRGVIFDNSHTGCTVNIAAGSQIYVGANAAGANLGAVEFNTAGNTLTVNNSLLAIDASGGGNSRPILLLNGGTYGASDHNTFADGSEANAFYNSGNLNFAGWKAATGQDANSVETATAVCPL